MILNKKKPKKKKKIRPTDPFFTLAWDLKEAVIFKNQGFDCLRVRLHRKNTAIFSQFIPIFFVFNMEDNDVLIISNIVILLSLVY